MATQKPIYGSATSYLSLKFKAHPGVCGLRCMLNLGKEAKHKVNATKRITLMVGAHPRFRAVWVKVGAWTNRGHTVEEPVYVMERPVETWTGS